ncbi:zinc ribbon domain-containing protein [Halorubrum salsamenti]|uniref:zinc ribbon domain-containing protein n=1 Tax=Halorubrum salsamenti TaxID=2583990 RepID=UPI00119D62E9|nr:zinc ribbon domain-containing protein [Halorubrum salsamenti]
MRTATSNSGRHRKQLLKGVLAGMGVTTLAYLLPVVSLFGPILGGATAAYIGSQSTWGGVKSGLLNGIGMTLPAILLGVFFGQALADVPVIGGILAGSLGLIILIIISHSIAFGLIGGVLGGYVTGTTGSAPEAGTSSGTVTTDNRATRSTTNEATSDGGQNRQTRICRNCGVSYSQDVDFCRECGTESPFSKTDADADDREAASKSTEEPDQTSPLADENEPETTAEDVSPSCTDCGADVGRDMRFCPECGTASPLRDTSDSDRQSSAGSRSPQNTGPATGSRSPADRDDGATDSPPDRSDAGDSESARTVSAADTVSTRKRPESDVAEQLCRVLSDPDADESRVESVLGDAVERLESDAALTDAVSGLDDSPTARQLESARSRVARSDGDAASGLLPVFDRAIELAEERDRSETERDRHREAAERLCRAADGTVDLGSGDVADRATALADAIERGEVAVERPSSSLSSLADRVRADARPRSSETRRLLDALDDGDEAEAAERLRSTVERLDELSEVQAAIADIEVSDVRRRIESLERDLQRADGNVYRHLADRVRELEAMADEPDVDEVQLYAIYQECTFYDRTLVPRLSRSDGPSESVDVARRVHDVEDRIASVNEEYVSVRADHNHTIPKHFLDLADTLCDRARRMGDEQPQRAAGQLAAASDLLDHVEELYERNEYSVMLRRLRG